jgi:hypothetical protein
VSGARCALVWFLVRFGSFVSFRMFRSVGVLTPSFLFYFLPPSIRYLAVLAKVGVSVYMCICCVPIGRSLSVPLVLFPYVQYLYSLVLSSTSIHLSSFLPIVLVPSSCSCTCTRLAPCSLRAAAFSHRPSPPRLYF